MSSPRDTLADYKLFTPPMPLDFEGWSRQEATSYFEWFKSQLGERMKELSRVIVRSRPECKLDLSPDSLFCLGEAFLGLVTSRPSTKQEEVEESDSLPPHLKSAVAVDDLRLTEEALSLSVDIGIYFAEVLRKHNPTLKWILWTRKTVDHNRPVLTGFRGDVPLDPVRIATNTALNEVHGEHNQSRLRELFDIWSAKVS